MFNLEAVSVQRLYRLIAERIAKKIQAGEFSVGDRLPAERELAEVLQVSRSSVREALIALELSGYVEVRMGSGVFVVASHATGGGPAESDAAPSLAHVASDIGPFELLDTRLLIEPECAALAAQNGTMEQLAGIRQAQAALSGGGALSPHDRAFHAAIAAACGNAALEAVVMHVWDLSEASPVYQRLDQHYVDRNVWDFALVEHDRIVSAICDRDPSRARHAMNQHLIGIVARLREDAPTVQDVLAPFRRR